MPLRTLCPICDLPAPTTRNRNGFEIEIHKGPTRRSGKLGRCAGSGVILKEIRVVNTIQLIAKPKGDR